MTQSGAPTPPPPPLNEAEYARKLALAILSTLQTKGLLSAAEVDAILIAARRAAQGQGTPAPATPPAQAREPRPAAVPFQVTVQPAPPPTGFSWRPGTPPAEGTDQDSQTRDQTKEKPDGKTPPVIDMQLD